MPFPRTFQAFMLELSLMKWMSGDQQENNSGAIVANCQDLLTTILLPLPAKTLMKLKIVSKQFHYVISSPQFGILHFRMHQKNRRSLSPTGLYFYSSFSNSSEIYTVAISYPERSIPSLSNFELVAAVLGRQFKIVQACNGLLLCSFDYGNSSNSSSARQYLVCNPTTQAFTMLPKLPLVESSSNSKIEDEVCDLIHTLAFDPLQTHVYKVYAVRVVKQIARKCTCEVLVYSSDEGGRVWRKAREQFSIPVWLKRIRHGVFHDGGKITWICERGFIYFDVQAEKVTKLPKRSTPLSTFEQTRFFGQSIDGRLHLIKRRKDYDPGVNVSEFIPEISNWKIRAKLNNQFDMYHRHLEGVQYNYLNNYTLGFRSSMHQILSVADNGNEVIVAIPGMVLHYCRDSRTSFVLRRLPPQQFPGNFSFDCVTSFQFVATLSPV